VSADVNLTSGFGERCTVRPARAYIGRRIPYSGPTAVDLARSPSARSSGEVRIRTRDIQDHNQAVPERTAVASAGFWIFDRSLAALETPTASVEVTQPREIDLYATMFTHLQAAASHGPAARTLINKALSELRFRRDQEPGSA
jgi:hypothetical protein